ncbi:MAG: hypothetical protein IKW98_06175 [Prevotella sp.]|nr:hypothetical protein [Prevotella sp.]
MVKRSIIVLSLMFGFLLVQAQEISRRVTEYEEFKPAVIHLVSGKDVSTPKANIFLKNSTLLYLSGTKTKEAFTDNLKSVDFDDRTYYRVDTLLAYKVDSVGTSALFCARLIDMNALGQMIRSSRQITNIDVGDQITATSLRKVEGDEFDYPIVNQYYFLCGGKIVRAREHEVLRATPKARRRAFWSTVREAGFQWSSEESLMKLLKAITES